MNINEKGKLMDKERLIYIAKTAAKAILSQTITSGDGGYTSCFGPITYKYLIDIVADGNIDGYCNERKRNAA